MPEVQQPVVGQAEVEYRDIEGYPGYRIGNDGSVWTQRKRGRCGGVVGNWSRRQTFAWKNGYRRVTLHRSGKGRTFYVHRLVLVAFIGPCPEGMESRHVNDNDRGNNNLNNLCWGTKKENAADRDRHGSTPRGEKIGDSKLTDEQVKEIRRLYAETDLGQRDIAKMFGLAQCPVARIVTGKGWKHVTGGTPVAVNMLEKLAAGKRRAWEAKRNRL